MTEVIFGELEEIVPRIAWPNEALDFTPWLSANLTRLGAAIGLQMELVQEEMVQEEMAVGRFAADILAHSHLGQILTYLTGLNRHSPDSCRVVRHLPRFRVLGNPAPLARAVDGDGTSRRHAER